jgi:hypothetical protein
MIMITEGMSMLRKCRPSQREGLPAASRFAAFREVGRAHRQKPFPDITP